jgi:hypothetical protein
MENCRKLVLFPVDQFYAIVGSIALTMEGGPYSLTIADICNEKSSATHGAREHLHRPGKIYLSAVEFYSLRDNTQKVCSNLNTVHLALRDIRGIIDYHPEHFQGNPLKRLEHKERRLREGSVRFCLHEHVFFGVADESDIYRLGEQFIGLSKLRIEEVPETENLSLPGFLEMIGCRQPDYMAVNLAGVFHS